MVVDSKHVQLGDQPLKGDGNSLVNKQLVFCHVMGTRLYVILMSRIGCEKKSHARDFW